MHGDGIALDAGVRFRFSIRIFAQLQAGNLVTMDFVRSIGKAQQTCGRVSHGQTEVIAGTCAYRKSSPSILVMQSTQDRTRQNASFSAARDIGASLFNDK